MTRATHPISYYLAPSLWVLSTAVAAGNWYLQPEGGRAWAASVVLLGCLTLAFLLALRRSPEGSTEAEAAQRRFRDSLRRGILFAGLMVLFSLSWRLATALGAASDPDVWRRATMAVGGSFLVVTGNGIPKTLTPWSCLQDDTVRIQAFQRFVGWTWVLTGLALAITWLVLPVELAGSLTLILVPTALLLIAAQTIRLWRARQRTA
ncbi:MAG TPA: hypothetical protein VJX29_10465 [Candidatus Acidoferrales bacterium]|nr:hypothetical protein [Candidatus Acidoferrales bacterium]